MEKAGDGAQANIFSVHIFLAYVSEPALSIARLRLQFGNVLDREGSSAENVILN